MGTTTLLVALAPRLGGFGVPKFFQAVFAVAVKRCLWLRLHPERVPQAAAGSVLRHGVQALPGHRSFCSKSGGSMPLLVRDLAP